MNNVTNNPPVPSQQSSDNSKALSIIGVLASAFSFFFLTIYDMESYGLTYFGIIDDTIESPILPPFDNIFTVILIFMPLIFLVLCLLATFRRKKSMKGLAITSIITYIIGVLMFVTIQSYGPQYWMQHWESVHMFPILLFIIGMIIVSKNAVKNQSTSNH